MHWINREKRNDQEHHEKVSFLIWLSFRMFFFLMRKCPLHTLLVMFFHVGNRFQMFFKAGIKSFAIFTGKHLCWSLFLIKLQDWRLAFSLKKKLQHRCFHINIARFLKTAFLWNTFHFTFPQVMMDIRYLMVIFCY